MNKLTRYLSRHSALVNAFLSLAVAILSGVWVNLLSEEINQRQLPSFSWFFQPSNGSLYLIGAFIAIWLQIRYNQSLLRGPDTILHDLLSLGIKYIQRVATQPVGERDVRGFIQLKKVMKPGEDMKATECLFPIIYWSIDKPRDNGQIPINPRKFRDWFVIVKAYHTEETVCEEPSATKPDMEGYYVDTASEFNSKSVISTPLWNRTDPQCPYVFGTLTFDSKKDAKSLKWLNDNGQCHPAAKEMIEGLAEVVSHILCNGTKS